MIDARIDARIEAYRAPATPPFEAVTRRKQRRDRRRFVTAGAGLAAAAGALAAVVVAVPGWDRPGLPGGFAGGDENGGTTFVLRPVGFQNDKAEFYTAAAERCLALPGVTGGPATSATPPFYRLSATGQDVSRLRSCVTEIGADAEEVAGRPGDERGQAEFVDRCVGATDRKVEEQYVGLTEPQVRQSVAGPVRVICQDRVYFDRSLDGQRDRLNLIIDDGVVLWASYF